MGIIWLDIIFVEEVGVPHTNFYKALIIIQKKIKNFKLLIPGDIYHLFQQQQAK
jgi:hypothetical protein